MTRNTKEVALIQIRSGKLSEMPKALHQSEFGLAKDANRVFLGNASNTLLKNRTIFPYQNLELLTEFSELKDYFKYSYENNITSALNGSEVDRLKLKEFLPIVISCNQESPVTTDVANGSLIINNIPTEEIPSGTDMNGIVGYINMISQQTQVYATVFPGTRVITFICTTNELTISDNSNGMTALIGVPPNPAYDISMPIRRVTEKLDDNLNITDFGVKGDGTNYSKRIFEAIIEIYKNYPDTQFYRNIFFPAGTYTYDITNEENNASFFMPFPLISNLHVHGEGIDRTKIVNNTQNTLISCIDDNFNSEFADSSMYGNSGGISNIVIEDMTFESSSSELMRLIGCDNVTFNRVKFVGSASNILAEIYGKYRSIQGFEDDLLAQNIIFNECIFESAATAINIEEYAQNITLNNCQFKEIQSPSVVIGNDDEAENVRCVDITNCTFTNSSIQKSNTAIIELGINSKYVTVTSCSFDNNIIERTEANGTIPYRDNGVGEDYNSLGTYAEGDKCIFNHKYYVANTDISEPEEFDESHWTEYERYNYTDILNINTDELKLLRFKFSQPLWEYINYLTNTNGKIVLTVDGKDTDITADNGLNILENENGVEIKSVKSGDVVISLDTEATLELGKQTSDIGWKPSTSEESITYYEGDEVLVDGIIYICINEHVAAQTTFEEDQFTNETANWSVKSLTQIVIDRVLQLNDHMISNRDGSKDIIIEPATDKVIEIHQTVDSDESYEDKIIEKPDAIPNVAFVRKYSTGSIIKHITKSDLESSSETGDIVIGTFPLNQYGKNIHITGITINVRNPFYRVVPYLTESSASYKNGYTYYQGDVVKGSSGGTTYAVILKTHKAESDIITTSSLMEVIDPETYTNDIKYVAVYGSKGNATYNLTETCNSNYYSNYVDEDVLTKENVNIQKNNLFGYTSAPDFDTSGTHHYGLADEIVNFQDRNYLIYKTADSFDPGEDEDYNSTDLHVSNDEPIHDQKSVKRIYDEGFVYKFDEDRNFNIGMSKMENPYSINYAGGSILMRFFTENGPVTSENKDTCLLNPAGDMIIKVDFEKEELLPPDEEDNG